MHDSNGFVEEMDNPKRIAQKINDLLLNEDRRKDFGLMSKFIFDKKFTYNEWKKNMLNRL
jgi:hypothetical protein